jgi:hypothetical protein
MNFENEERRVRFLTMEPAPAPAPAPRLSAKRDLFAACSAFIALLVLSSILFFFIDVSSSDSDALGAAIMVVGFVMAVLFLMVVTRADSPQPE